MISPCCQATVVVSESSLKRTYVKGYIRKGEQKLLPVYRVQDDWGTCRECGLTFNPLTYE